MANNRGWQFCLGVGLYLIMQAALAAAFNATVDSTKIPFGQSIQLKLRLDAAKALEPLDASVLAHDFMIYNQAQFSAYKNINGTVTAEVGWNISLMPKKEGEFVIPSISILTDKGRLSTQEIRIHVQHPKPGDKPADDGLGISLVTNVSKHKAYVNEPIIYTLKIISYKPVANVVLDDIKSTDAIIEKIGEPKQYNQTHGGVNAHIIEIRYAVTALREGKVTIAPALMHGEIHMPTQPGHRPQRFGLFNDLFLDNMVELKPFSMQTETITIDALPPPVKGKDWLPLRSLSITDKWDGVQNVKVGETITRKIKMVAKGAFAKQLPSVKDFMELPDLKSYANKPIFNDSFDYSVDTIVGTREEEYSIVPQHEGSFTFPEVKISWWNLRTNKLETTTLPEKTIQIGAGSSTAAPNVTIDYSAQGEPQEIKLEEPVAANTKPITLYILIGVLSGIMIAALCGLTIFVVYKKLAVRSKQRTSRKPKPKPKPKAAQEIAVKTSADLRVYILQYAVKTWQIAANTTLNRIGDALSNNNYSYDIAVYDELSKNLNAALYAGANLELEDLQQQWEEFRRSVQKVKTGSKRTVISDDETSLNPT